MIRFIAHFDGQKLSPDEPVNLPTGTPLQVTVEEVPAKQPSQSKTLKQLFDELEQKFGLFDGPEDLSAELDHYLYGGPKQGESNGG